MRFLYLVRTYVKQHLALGSLGCAFFYCSAISVSVPPAGNSSHEPKVHVACAALCAGLALCKLLEVRLYLSAESLEIYKKLLYFFCLSAFSTFLILSHSNSEAAWVYLVLSHIFLTFVGDVYDFFFYVLAGSITGLAVRIFSAGAELYEPSLVHCLTFSGSIIASALLMFIREGQVSEYIKLTSALQGRLDNYQTFVGYLGHEMRVPLQGIKGVAELLLRTDCSSNMIWRYVRVIGASCTQLLTTASAVLDFSRMNTWYRSLDPTKFNIALLVEEVVSEMEAMSVLQNTSVNVFCPKIDVFLDFGKMKHIFRNLLSNAIKNTKSGRVDLQVFLLKSGDMYFSVADTGDGMPSEERENLFSNEMEEESILQSYSRTGGIGLLIVKHFVRMHKGRIWAEQNSPTGTIFAFVIGRVDDLEYQAGNCLPYREQLAENIFWKNVSIEVIALANAWAEGRRIKVLVVDDDPISVTSSKFVLENMCMEVSTASSIEECLLFLRMEKVELIFLDVMTGPDISGYMQEIQEKAGNASIIFQTGLEPSVLARIAERTKVVGYLLKPYGGKEIKSLLESIAAGQASS